MDKEAFVGRYDFEVEPFQEDFTGRLSWGVLGNLLLRCASLHASAYGFGFNRVEGDAYAWVLSRMVVELDEMPRTGDRFTLETWVSSLYRLFTDRMYALKAPDGSPLGYAMTIWALIDKRTRRPVELEKLADENLHRVLVEGRACPVKAPGRIRVERGKPALTYTAHFTDIDINGHFNSIRYIELVLNLFPMSQYATHGISRLEVAYSAETMCGDELALYTEEKAPDVTAVEICKRVGDREEVAVRAEITFKPYDTNNS
mgnify:CR=1 FL=1